MIAYLSIDELKLIFVLQIVPNHTMYLNTLPEDVIDLIVTSFPVKPLLAVNHFFHNISMVRLDSNVRRLQKWYRSMRLVHKYPPDMVTYRTLLRYYVAKHSTERLEQFPRKIVQKCRISGVSPDETKPIVGNVSSRFMKFAERHLRPSDIKHYGW